MIPHEDLSQRIRLGEDSTLELKRVLLSGTRVTGPDWGALLTNWRVWPMDRVEP